MKKILLSIIAFLSFVFSQEYNIEDLLEQDGVFIKKFSDEELNGKVYLMYGDTKVYLGKMKKGKKDGTWTEWYENGLKRSKTVYFKGLINGKREWWSEYGKMDSSGTYKDGKLNGQWTSWYENGQKWKESNYKDGEPDGLVTRWYENGQKKEEVTYKDGKKDGLETWWRGDGQKNTESTYKDGELIEEKTWDYYENRQKKEEVTYKDGEKDGLWTEWYENGQKKEEVTYKDGKKDGLWTEWYENGQKQEEVTYKDGKEDGLYTIWHENGQKRTQGNYKNGEIDGLWTYYRKDGSNEKEGYFENRVKTHKRWYWDENGKYYHLMRIVLEVDLPTLMENLAINKDNKFDQSITSIRGQLAKTPEADFFTLFSSSSSDNNLKLSRYYYDYGSNNQDILTALGYESEDAINRVLEILQNRLDQFGIAEPTIQKQGSQRIIVELAGVQDSERTRSLLESTALLEFFLVKDVNTTNEILLKIDQALKGDETIADVIKSASVEEAEETKESYDQTVSVSELFGDTEDLGASSDSPVVDEEIFSERPFSSMLRALGQTIGVPEKNVYAVKKILERQEVQEKLASVHGTFLFSHKAEKYPLVDGTIEKMYSLYLLEDKAEFTGGVVEEAKANLGPQGSTFVGQPIVNLTMNSDGARKWSIVTGSNVGRQVAIVLDKKVRMAPNIREKISNGRTLIEGFANINEAKDFAIVIRAGVLPAPVYIIEERIVKKYVNE